MIQTITENDFIEAFNNLRPDNFSQAGLATLYRYFEELEEDINEQIELDVIAICCEYVEYGSLEELNNDYCNHFDSLDELSEHTTVIQLSDYTAVDDNSFIIIAF